MNEILDTDRISNALGTKWLGRSLIHQPSVDSTNDLLLEMAAQGQAAGTVVLADFQRKGRGRLGRSWQAPPGTSLLFSMLFLPDWPAARAPWLTMIAGLAVVEAVTAETGLSPGLKWPNDIVMLSGDLWRKVGGLLLEGEFADGCLRSAVLGIGLNVNISPADLPEASPPATSFQAELGRPVPRMDLLAGILRGLERRYQDIEEGHSPWPAWNDRLVTLGRAVCVRGVKSGETVEGIAEATDEWGRLLVRELSGRLLPVAAGDVTLRS
jgi:BirA family biotin operon repressor/biotin-[acetyl-CoA-carboxylase] ligase